MQSQEMGHAESGDRTCRVSRVAFSGTLEHSFGGRGLGLGLHTHTVKITQNRCSHME